MLAYVHQFLASAAFSIIIEGLVVLLLCFVLKKDKRVALIAVFGTLCTIPYVWFVFPTLLWQSSSLIVPIGESFAFLIEALLYRFIGKLSWKYAFLFSLLANTASFFLGKLFL